MKRTLIIGATGFVGANLVRRLLTDGHKVDVLCRPESDYWRLKDISQDIEIHHQPLVDKEALEECISKIKPEWVFHLAAHGAYSWQNNTAEIIATNILGTANLLACLLNTGCESFIAAGSSSEYGYKSFAPDEEDWIEPNSEYAIAKAASTHFCRFYAQKHGLNTAVLRLYSVYGPYEDPDRLIPKIIEHGMNQTLPPLVDANIARDFIFVDDAVAAFIGIAGAKNHKPGTVYNVGSGKQTTIGKVVELAKEIFNISEEPIWGSMPNRKWDTANWIANIYKIRSTIGWEPKYSLKDGLLKTAEWSRKKDSTDLAISLQSPLPESIKI